MNNIKKEIKYIKQKEQAGLALDKYELLLLKYYGETK